MTSRNLLLYEISCDQYSALVSAEHESAALDVLRTQIAITSSCVINQVGVVDKSWQAAVINIRLNKPNSTHA